MKIKKEIILNSKHFKLIIGALIILIIYLFMSGGNDVIIEKGKLITDTIYVDKPYKVIQIKEIEVPKEVIIYKRDTVFRNEIEKDTIITGIEINEDEIEVHTITPIGVVEIKKYALPNIRQDIKINNKGQINILPKKDRTKLKKRLRRITMVGVFILGIVLGSR